MSKNQLICLNIAIVIALVLVMSFAGGSDYKQAKIEEAIYCKAVAAGEHPAYKGKEFCGGVK